MWTRLMKTKHASIINDSFHIMLKFNIIFFSVAMNIKMFEWSFI